MPKKVFDIFNGVKRFVSVNLKSSRNTYEVSGINCYQFVKSFNELFSQFN